MSLPTYFFLQKYGPHNDMLKKRKIVLSRVFRDKKYIKTFVLATENVSVINGR